MKLKECTNEEINLVDKKVEEAIFEDKKAYILENKIFAFEDDERIVLSVRGVSLFQLNKKFVVVDDGGIPYVCRGANVMAPGVIDADDEIKPNDWVWVAERKERTPLAVGYAIMSGKKMVENSKGVAVKTINHVGDKIWRLKV